MQSLLFPESLKPDDSVVLGWLPVLLGLLVFALSAFAFCPVPRAQTISVPDAVLLSIKYPLLTVGPGVLILLTLGRAVGWPKRGTSARQSLPAFLAAAVWVPPATIFYRRQSLWAVGISAVLGASVCRLVYRHYHDLDPAREPVSRSEQHVAECFSASPSLIASVLAALVLHLAAVSITISEVHLASMLTASASVMICWWRQAIAVEHDHHQCRFRAAAAIAIPATLAVFFVGASLTPYLSLSSVRNDIASSDSSAVTKSPPPMRTPVSTRSTLTQSVAAFSRVLSAKQSGTQANSPQTSAGRAAYRVLLALFGERGGDNAAEREERERNSGGRRSTALVVGDSYLGVILRPEVKDHVTIVPPPVTRRVFNANPNVRKTESLSIPFYGAYWFFRTSDKELPAGSVETRGDPASISFKTNDFTPISMEARQNFGSLISASCCRAIELVISNGDRRPGTVGVELILRNTRLGDNHSNHSERVP